jgi:hypothetical protein
MQDKTEDQAKFRRASLQLQRLARMVDVVYAIITLPFAFVGPILWEISWLSYPLVVLLVRGRRRAKKVE